MTREKEPLREWKVSVGFPLRLVALVCAMIAFALLFSCLPGGLSISEFVVVCVVAVFVVGTQGLRKLHSSFDWIPTSREATLTFDGQVLRLGSDRIRIDREVTWCITTRGELADLTVTDLRESRSIQVELNSVARARSICDAIGLDPSRHVFRTLVNESGPVVFALCAAIFVLIVARDAFDVTTFAGTVTFAFVAFLYGVARSTELTVGTDGLHVKRGFRKPSFIPFVDVVEGHAKGRTLTLVRRTGKPLRVVARIIRFPSLGFRRGDHWAEAVRTAIESRMSNIEPVASLPPTRIEIEPNYRTAAVSTETLRRVADDGAQSERDRLSALDALAERGEAEDAWLEDLASKSASPEVVARVKRMQRAARG